MTDFQAWNHTTHPIVRLEDDYNNILHHAFEKRAAYLVRKNGSYYDAIQGSGTSGGGTIAYGGVNNAGATDGTSFHDVLDATLADGRLIALRDDTYTLDASVDLTGYEGLTITGESFPHEKTYGTIITLADSVDDDMFKATSGKYISLQNLQLMGNDTAQASGCGIDFDSIDAPVLRNVFVFECKEEGINITDGAEGRLVHVIARDNHTSGIYVLQEQTSLTNCTASHNTTQGIALTWKGMTVSHCISYLNGANGFNLYQLYYSNFFGCKAWANGYHGFNINDCDDDSFFGCSGSSNSADTNQTYSGALLTDSTHIKFFGGDYISDTDYYTTTQKYGIGESGTCSSNLAFGCVCRGNDLEQIYFTDTGSNKIFCTGDTGDTYPQRPGIQYLSVMNSGVDIAVGAGNNNVAIAWGAQDRPLDANYGVRCAPDWDTTYYISLKAVTGFTINFGAVAPGGGGLVDYVTYRTGL